MSKTVKKCGIILVLVAIIVIADKMVDIQKTNNYNRCKSVVGAAIMTGRLPKNTSIEEKCGHYKKRLL